MTTAGPGAGSVLDKLAGSDLRLAIASGAGRHPGPTQPGDRLVEAG